MTTAPILATLIYPLRDGDVLLIERNKEPNRGLWVGLGGKLEPGESPYECARRELYEETNLQARRAHFRGLVTITEVMPRPEWQWLLFVFAITDFVGQLHDDGREGRLKWWPCADVPELPIPQADAVFFSHVIDLQRPFYQAKFVYNADLKLIRVHEHPA